MYVDESNTMACDIVYAWTGMRLGTTSQLLMVYMTEHTAFSTLAV